MIIVVCSVTLVRPQVSKPAVECLMCDSHSPLRSAKLLL